MPNYMFKVVLKWDAGDASREYRVSTYAGNVHAARDQVCSLVERSDDKSVAVTYVRGGMMVDLKDFEGGG